MTMPDERTRAVVQTAEFLRELTMPSASPGVPDIVRETARRLMRHYPGRGDMNMTHTAMPMWWGALPALSSDPRLPPDGSEPARTPAEQDALEEEAVNEVLSAQAARLPEMLEELSRLTVPGSVARAELVARLETLRSRFALSAGIEAP